MWSQRCFFLFVLLSTICPCTNAQFDPEDFPTQNLTSAPDNPVPVMEPKHRLDSGETYADPQDNPFNIRKNIIFGPKSKARFADFDTSLPLVNDTDQCEPPAGNSGPQQKWANHLVEVLSNDGVVQSLGFSFDLFQKLEAEEGQVGELTVGRGMNFDEPAMERRAPKAHMSSRWVIGPDDRTLVTRTLIGPRHVLTAGHCVHSGKGGTWHKNLKFTIFKTSGNDKTFDWAKVYSVVGWTKYGNWDYDYALIILKTPDTKQSWIPFGYHTGLSKGWKLNLNGFPSDKPAKSMWHSYGPVIATTNLHFDHEIDAVAKQTGSGIYLYQKKANKRVIYGIHSTHRQACYPNFPDFWNCYTVRWNTATRINKQRFKQICGWMNSKLC
ncbi:trypsin-like cysteine/serine peptidase domain-containing protein [Tirmania nivea]|nr:trypsin-like cysteine/serine peptidase domain-containing protein [Tirmania nivea]